MCNSCFNTEIPEFISHEEFQKFDLELSKKIKPFSNSGLKYFGDFGFAHERGMGKYICQDCNTEWWYSEPEQSWSGFFVRKENGKRTIAKHQQGTRIKSFGCLIVLILIIGVIWFLVTLLNK